MATQKIVNLLNDTDNENLQQKMVCYWQWIKR